MKKQYVLSTVVVIAVVPSASADGWLSGGLFSRFLVDKSAQDSPSSKNINRFLQADRTPCDDKFCYVWGTCVTLDNGDQECQCLMQDGVKENPDLPGTMSDQPGVFGCLDIDECTQENGSTNVCAMGEGGFCVDWDPPVKYQCGCLKGYRDARFDSQFGAVQCSDINECIDGVDGSSRTFPCSPNAQCTNTNGGFVCDCEEGFVGDGIDCLETDTPSPAPTEACLTDTDCTGFGTGSFCEVGSGKCLCEDGYFSTNPGFSPCSFRDVCTTSKNPCDVPRAACTPNVSGPPFATCACVSGFESAPGTTSGTSCISAQNCAVPPQCLATSDCPPNCVCQNGQCLCVPGFICIDTDPSLGSRRNLQIARIGDPLYCASRDEYVSSCAANLESPEFTTAANVVITDSTCVPDEILDICSSAGPTCTDTNVNDGTCRPESCDSDTIQNVIIPVDHSLGNCYTRFNCIGVVFDVITKRRCRLLRGLSWLNETYTDLEDDCCNFNITIVGTGFPTASPAPTGPIPSNSPTDTPEPSRGIDPPRPSMPVAPTYDPPVAPALTSIIAPIPSPTMMPSTTRRILSDVDIADLFDDVVTADFNSAKTCKCVDCQDDSVCGGLWKGTAVGGDAHIMKHLHLVVSHCRYSLEWLDEYTQDFPIDEITIFSKCNQPVEGAPSGANIVRMANFGRNDHTFASWIVSRLDNDSTTPLTDSSTVIFLKDDLTHMHQTGTRRSMEEMLRIVSVRGFACGVEPDTAGLSSSTSVFHERNALLQFDVDEYSLGNNIYHDDEGILFNSQYANLEEWATSIGVDFSLPIIPVCYGGVFATTGSQIAKHGKALWTDLKNSLSRGNNIEEGHFAERVWAHLLSNQLNDGQIAALVQYSDAIVEDGFSYAGTLVSRGGDVDGVASIN